MEPFREYKAQRQSWKPRRRIPIGRSLLVILLVYAVYASGAVQKAYRYVEKVREFSREEPEPFSKPWREACAAFGGNAFALERGMLAQCSWTVKSASDIASLPDNALFRYAARGISRKFPLCVHWIADSLEFEKPKVLGVQSDSSGSWLFHLMLADSSYAWVRSDGCRFPGACPHDPLQGAALPIAADFDFEGRENLLVKDLFMGIGEAPIYPILSAEVVSVSRDSSGYGILLNHGGNIFSRVSELFRIAPGIRQGTKVSASEPLGYLAPSDSAVFFLEILRNGRFVRWDDFRRDSRVADLQDVERFRRELGF